MEKYINLSINKSETNSNWMKRPFSNNQLKYASEDVEFLIDIYTKQNKLLDKKGKLKEAFYLSKEEAGLGNQELYISRLQKIKDKSEIDEKIFMWREELAKKKDIPTSFILSDKKLKKLSKRFFQEGLESDLSDLIDNNEHVEDFLNCLSK